MSYAEFVGSCGVEYPVGVKSAGFRSQLRASRLSSHTDELRYNETVMWMTIYIYIYICVCVCVCVCVCACIYVRVCVYIYICVSVYIYV